MNKNISDHWQIEFNCCENHEQCITIYLKQDNQGTVLYFTLSAAENSICELFFRHYCSRLNMEVP